MEAAKTIDIRSENLHTCLNYNEKEEDQGIQVDGCHLTSEERNLPEGSYVPVGATAEHLRVEEKTIGLGRNEEPDGDTAVQEIDPKEVEEGSAKQENELKQKHRPEVSWIKNKGHFTRQKRFYFSGSYEFLELVRHL